MRPRKLCYQVLGDWNLRGFCKKRSLWNERFSLYRTLMVLDVFAMLNLQYLGIMSICRMSDGWSSRRICKKDLGMKDFLKTLTVLVVYAVVSFQYIGIIARQNICRLISGCTVFHECVNRIFPKSDLAL